MLIQNPQVHELYARWEKVFDNSNNDDNTRLKAFAMMQVVQSIAYIYERGEKLDEESFDDLFIKYESDNRPIYKEEREEVMARFRKAREDREKTTD